MLVTRFKTQSDMCDKKSKNYGPDKNKAEWLVKSSKNDSELSIEEKKKIDLSINIHPWLVKKLQLIA